jgi:hypothetical protein
MMPREIVIVDAVRTPVVGSEVISRMYGRTIWGAHVLQQLVARSEIPVDQIEDVIFGCVTQVVNNAVMCTYFHHWRGMARNHPRHDCRPQVRLGGDGSSYRNWADRLRRVRRRSSRAEPKA